MKLVFAVVLCFLIMFVVSLAVVDSVLPDYTKVIFADDGGKEGDPVPLPPKPPPPPDPTYS